MSYNESMVYCEPGVDPKIGVSQRDVQRALSTTRHYWHELCAHQNINKWAKYKPVSYPGVEVIGYAARLSVNFGLSNIPIFLSKKLGQVALLVFDQTQSTSGQNSNRPECGFMTPELYWGYQPPTGGMNSAFRITDFVAKGETTVTYEGVPYTVNDSGLGYVPRAMPPLQELAPDDGTHADGKSILDAAPNGYFTLSFPQNLYMVSAGCVIRYEDLRISQISLSQTYFGIAFRKPGSGNTVYAVSNEFKTEDMSGEIGTSAQGNRIRIAMSTTLATALFGDKKYEGDIEYFLFMSTARYGSQKGSSGHYEPTSSLSSATDVMVLDMVPKTCHLSVKVARPQVLELTATNGRYPTKLGVKVSFKLKSASSGTEFSVKVTVKVYKSYNNVPEDLIGTKTATYPNVSDEETNLKEIVLTQGDELPQNFTAVMANIEAEAISATSNEIVFKENYSTSISIS